MRLKNKVVMLIAVILLSVSIGTTMINHWLDIQHTQEQLQNTSLPLSVDNIYTDVQHRMIEPLLVSSLMANDTFLKDWVISGEVDEKLVTKYLREIQEKYHIFTSFFVSNMTRYYYHPKGLIDTVNEKNADDVWFFNFKNSGEEYEINLDYNKNLDHSLIMFINYKVRDYLGQFIGATGVGIKLFNLEEMLESFKKKYRYDVYFVDTKGEIMLYSKLLDKRGNIHTIGGLKEQVKRILESKNSQFEYANKDGSYLLNVKYIEKLKLYIFVEINKKEYMEELRQGFYINLFISFLVTLVVILVIIKTINIYQRQLEALASEDSLTKLSNRRTFNEYFEKILKLHNRSIHDISLVLFDIDHFKKVNDTMGHLVGDDVLIRIATILKETFRKSDMIARWGGEEFAILLVDTTEEDALKLSEKLREKIASDHVLQALCKKTLTISAGVGVYKNTDSQDGLLQRVDDALYAAKNNGRNQVVVAHT